VGAPQLFASRRSSVVVQPCNRGTGPGVLLPLMLIARTDANAGIIYLPSDHYVENEAVLNESMRQAMAPQRLDCGKITLLGITPDAPDSGFGYFTPSPDAGAGMRPVQRLIEKPDPGSAAQLVRGGSAWTG
jgi:mannose-1-phosphate guanylyltransferase